MSSSSPPADECPFPPEVLSRILRLAVEPAPGDLYFGQETQAFLRHQNQSLASFALVSRQFRPCAYDVLYEDLRISLSASNAGLLFEALLGNEELQPMIRRIEVTGAVGGFGLKAWASLAASREPPPSTDSWWAHLSMNPKLDSGGIFIVLLRLVELAPRLKHLTLSGLAVSISWPDVGDVALARLQSLSLSLHGLSYIHYDSLLPQLRGLRHLTTDALSFGQPRNNRNQWNIPLRTQSPEPFITFAPIEHLHLHNCQRLVAARLPLQLPDKGASLTHLSLVDVSNTSLSDWSAEFTKFNLKTLHFVWDAVDPNPLIPRPDVPPFDDFLAYLSSSTLVNLHLSSWSTWGPALLSPSIAENLPPTLKTLRIDHSGGWNWSWPAYSHERLRELLATLKGTRDLNVSVYWDAQAGKAFPREKFAEVEREFEDAGLRLCFGELDWERVHGGRA